MRLPDMTAATAPYCGMCLDRPPAYQAAIAAVDCGAPIDPVVVSLKFGSRLALAPLFAQRLRDALLVSQSPLPALPTLLTPVPLSDLRLAIRLRDTDAQSTLHPERRRKNIRGAFMLLNKIIDAVHGQHVGVVADVMTTGETSNELAATFKRFGATRATNFVFAGILLA